jgi:hypothetical protein
MTAFGDEPTKIGSRFDDGIAPKAVMSPGEACLDADRHARLACRYRRAVDLDHPLLSAKALFHCLSQSDARS